MAKTKTPKYSIENFFTSSLSSSGSKLALTLPSGTKTDEYLLVMGYHADEMEDCREAGQRASAQLDKDLAKLKEGSKEYIKLKTDGLIDIHTSIAMVAVIGFSFDKFSKKLLKRLLVENKTALPFAVTAHAANSENYFKKK